MNSYKPERARSLVATFRGSVSRLTLSASLGLAGVSALPADSWAACVVGLSDVVCGTTVTTDTVFPINAPNDRDYVRNVSTVLLLTVNADAVISGYGLAARNTETVGGGVTVVNNGTIGVDAGNLPTAGGFSAALTLVSSGGNISYSGSGTLTNNGQGLGLYARQIGTGTVDITSTGLISSAASGQGIRVDGLIGAGDIRVNVVDVTAYGDGIRVINEGSGSSTVISTGMVSANDPGAILSDYAGISVSNEGAATDITIQAVDVYGAGYGIEAYNSATGNTTVTTTGLVSSQNNGIVVSNEQDAGDITIHAADVVVTDGVDAFGFVLGGIIASNTGNGATSVTATGTVDAGGAPAGILAYTDASTTSLTVNAASVVGGGLYGIFAGNGGTGPTSVTATGDVASETFGIYAVNGVVGVLDILTGTPAVTGPGGTSLTINAVNVEGGEYGAVAFNDGTGSTSVTVTGLAQGGRAGIIAINEADALDLTVNANDVTVVPGHVLSVAGIVTDNQGTGSTLVNVTGTVNAGGSVAGILARNGEDAGSFAGSDGSLTVNTFGAVSGGTIYGIVAANGGSGATAITATGDVAGDLYGIYAMNGRVALSGILDGDPQILDPGGTSLTIEATNVSGVLAGILALNKGSGPASVTATGLVQGGAIGVGAFDLEFGNDIIVNVADVTASEAGSTGVFGFNPSGGSVAVTASGTVRAGFTGVAAFGGSVNVSVADVIVTDDDSIGLSVTGVGPGTTTVSASGLIQAGTFGMDIHGDDGDIVVRANTVTLTGSEGLAGINVENFGTGSSTVTSTGAITGTGEVGIGVLNDITATSVTINAASASGSEYGIVVFNDGTGPTNITTSGMVMGGTAAIYVDTFSQSPTAITNNGTVANLDMLPSSLAVRTIGGPVDVINNGSLIGTVEFGDDGSSLTNAGVWYVPGGTSAFGAGANSLVNLAGGTIVAGTTDGTTATTVFDTVGTFTNRGTFTMAGGAAGDRASLTGAASFMAGSVYAVDVDATGAADLLTVNGTTALLAGSTVAVTVDGTLVAGTRYTVLTATSGVSGVFSTVSAPSTAFLAIDDVYDANNVYLDVSQVRTFDSAGETPNQIATAIGLQGLPANNGLFSWLLNLPTDALARAAFDQLSGEIGASAKGVLIGDSQFLRGVVFDRLTSAGSSTPAGGISVAPLGYAAQPKSQKAGDVPYPVKAEPAVAVPESAIWAQGFGSWGSTDGNANAASIDRNTGGFFIGADTLVGNGWRLGVLGGYSQTSFDVDQRASTGTSDNFHIGAYAGTNWGAVNFRAGASYTWNDISTSRNVFIPTAQLLDADYDAGTAQVFGELGYGLTFGAVDFEPFVGLAYVSLNTDGFTETGGIAALTSASDSTDATYSTLGLRASTTFALGSFNATAKGMLGWRHAFGDITPTTAYQFAAGSSPFTVGGVPIAEDAALVEVGLDLQLLPTATFGIAYGGEFGDGATDQSFTANLSVKF